MTETSGGSERGPVVWPLDPGIPWPWKTHHISMLAMKSFPTQTMGLLGWRVRIVRGGEEIGPDADPGRLNILVNDAGEIVDVIAG